MHILQVIQILHIVTLQGACHCLYADTHFSASPQPSLFPHSIIGPTHSLQPPATPAEMFLTSQQCRGQRPPSPLCSAMAVSQGNLPPCLPPSHKPPAAAGPPALPPAPEDTTVFVKQPWFQSSMYKQINFLANLITKQTFHKCTTMWFVRGNEPVDKSNTVPRSVY